ncbi:peptidylprolyl isomerase [Glycocaulis sp.]|uniref:peptidylprolyl isomerase n=1 Tax=Glycocaulis sp. TaxID=1969725 RepID=UPI003F7294EE
MFYQPSRGEMGDQARRASVQGKSVHGLGACVALALKQRAQDQGLKEAGIVCQSNRTARRCSIGLVALAGLSLAVACDTQQDRAAAPAEPAVQAEGRVDVLARFLALEPAGPEDSVVAEVGTTVIYASDVRREIAARSLHDHPANVAPSDPVFQQVLSELTEQRLLALEALRRGMDRDIEARRRLAAAEERILGNILVETVVANSITDEAIERIYQEQNRLAPRVEEVRASHILVTTREEAEEVARLLAEGEDFAQLARQVSQDPGTRLDGGDLGYFTRDGMVQAFSRQAFATETGETSEPFQTDYGWHVLRVTDRRVQPRPGLESLRGNIVRFLTLEGIQTLLDTVRQTYPVTRSGVPAPSQIRAPGPVPPGDPEESGEEEPDDMDADEADAPEEMPQR